jgi:hypothetical protein
MIDYKNYQAHDDAVLGKTIVILIVAAILAAIAYASESDYQECLKGNQSIVLCGGGNSK